MKSIAIILFSLFISCDSKKEIEQIVPVKGNICIIIDDFGNSMNETIMDFVSLKNDITFAVIPGLPYTKEFARLADSLEIETIIHMPMENKEYEGEYADYLLHERLNATEVKKRVNLAFSEIPNAIGMNNHQGSKATTSLQLMKDLARTLKPLNLYFIDSFTNPKSLAFITMRRYGVKTELRQIFLDHIEEEQYVRSQLDSLVILSKEMHVAIGIGHATKPLTIEILKSEIPKLKSEGYRFLKASEIVR